VKLPKINSNWLLLGLALLLGGGAAYLGNSVVQQHLTDLNEQAARIHEPVNVVVAKSDLAVGDTLSGENFAVRQVPNQYTNADSVRPDDFSGLQGQRLAVAMKRGDTLLPAHVDGQGAMVFSAMVKAGRRALTFEVDAVNSVSGMLRPGDRIDLVYSGKDNTAQAQDLTRVLLANVQVLATDQTLTRRDEQSGEERAFGTITLDLAPDEAQRVVVAKAAGRLTALLRNPDDKGLSPGQVLSAGQLFQSGAASTQARTVEYLVGGAGGGPVDVQRQLTTLGVALARP
jgi:pilus assembly protein CpaB